MFQRVFDEGLAQASFLIACSRTRQAVVVDPRRDIDVYVAAARADFRITHAIETHIHADFVSGASELAARGALVLSGPGSQLRLPHHEVRDQERLELGDVSLTFLHTPGHTPEHISILLRIADDPVRVLTGDTLFVGGVGRPDLLGEELSRELAAQLHESLYGKLLALDDRIEVHPGHGAGSLCGAGISGAPHSTIGQERRFNPMLQHPDRSEFIAAVLAELPDRPPYFQRMKRLNRDGPPVRGLFQASPPPAPIPPLTVLDAVRNGAVILDTRTAEAYAEGHPARAINIPFGAKVGFWAAWVIQAGSRIVLVADDERQSAEVRRQLLRVGLDEVLGRVEGGFDGWRRAGLPVATTDQISAAQLRERLARGERLAVVDVRTAHEWQAGHIEGALHLPVGDIPVRPIQIPAGVQVATICESGYRSSLAASLLERSGVTTIANVAGGMAAYRAQELRS